MSKFSHVAQQNLNALLFNPYPGRGIIAGLSETTTDLVQVYFVTGRSENSRNRIITEPDEFGFIKTAAADPKKVQDPSLIIYEAMAKFMSSFAVSNGHQTKDASTCQNLVSGLMGFQYEPDPSHTPRITARMSLASSKSIHSVQMSILKKSPFSEKCDRYNYELDISEPGVGYCITTYKGDGDPLPAFEGDPYLLPLVGDIKNVANSIWKNLNEDNRVSLVVRFINIKTGDSQFEIINKYQAV